MKKVSLIIITIAIASACVAVIYYYGFYMPRRQAKIDSYIDAAADFFLPKQPTTTIQPSDPAQNEKEAKALAEKVGRLMTLPKDEVPTVSTVSDPSKLASQSFFAKAEIGDKVLIYTQAKIAVLYDPSTDTIINVAPVNSN